MTKKLTRSKRKDLRSKGQLSAPVRLVEAQKAAERQADEEATSARVHAAREAIAQRQEEEEQAPAPVKKRTGLRRDHAVLLFVGLTCIAGVIYWLAERPPSETRPARPAASAAERAPIVLTAPRPVPAPAPMERTKP